MAVELAVNYGLSPEAYRAPVRLVEQEAPPQSELGKLIAHFDKDWKEEGLPRDWYSFGKAGFSMNSQMNLLDGLDSESVGVWIDRTEQDIRGFSLEYLKQELVHPAFYRKIVSSDGRIRLVDDKYNRGLAEMVSPKERNGAVSEALDGIENTLVENGGIAIMTSPRGWTGLHTDRGIPIEYPDSWFFSFLDMGDRVINFGVKTDFTLSECRQAIIKLTGEDLSREASIEDYVKAIAKINPNQGISTPQDLVRVLREIRPGPYVYKNKTWDEVEEKAGKLEDLYNLEEEAEVIIQDFREYNADSKFDYQKALAATLLRLSELYLGKNIKIKSEIKYEVIGDVIYPRFFQESEVAGPQKYGQILEEVEKIPGCAGGGTNQAITSVIDRLGIAGSNLGIRLPEDKYGSREVECPDCGKISIRPKDTLIPACLHCNSKSIAC